MDKLTTSRGFSYFNFTDRNGNECSLQKSSIATEDCIWLGLDEASPKILHGEARKLGIETEATSGLVDYPIPKEVSLNTRMHLSIEQVKELLPILNHFVKSGEVGE